MNSPTGRASISRPAHQVIRKGGKSDITATELRRRLEAIQMSNLPRHPLWRYSVYQHEHFDPRFGVHRYRCNNSTLSASHMGEEMGTTGVRYSLIYENPVPPIGEKPICILAWVRRHGTVRMQEAVACALMLGHETIVIAHAFGMD